MQRQPFEERILSRLREGPATMRDLHAATGRNYSSEQIQGLMADMCRDGEAFEEYVENGRGRPSIRFTMAREEGLTDRGGLDILRVPKTMFAESAL